MDYTLSNNLTAADVGVPGGAAIDKSASALKNVAAKVRNKAKAKKAAKIAAAGGYLTLTPFQKSLIPVPAYVGEQVKGISAATGQPATVDAVKNLPPIPATPGQMGAKLKTYLPWIIGAVLLAAVAYYFYSK
jgi:hypothetical protein